LPNASFAYTAITAASALSLTTQYTALGTALDTDEDIELAQAKMNEIQTRIQEWNTSYREALDRLKADKELKLSNSAAEANAVLQEQMNEYNGYVQRYAQQLELYKADIQRGLEVGRFEIEKIKAEVATLQVDAIKDLEADISGYVQDAQKKIEQARITLQEALTNAKNSTDVAVQNERATLEAAIADYDEELKLYSAQLNKYQADIQERAQKYASNINKAKLEYDAVQGQIGQLRQLYMTLASTLLGLSVAPAGGTN